MRRFDVAAAVVRRSKTKVSSAPSFDRAEAVVGGMFRSVTLELGGAPARLTGL